ncbi:MAG TPA: ABC-ATPase UvrA, partial [Candidatus Binatia bacterium]
MAGVISIRGARVHNLKNIDLDLPRERLIVITGVSGSGKSSLAFDTLFAEGQRRYLESLTADARQLLRQMERPDVDIIDGLSPAIAVQQRTGIYSARSTVGTITEIYDYLRLLFARAGTPRCLQCGREISAQTTEQIVDSVLSLPVQTRIVVLAPICFGPETETREGLRELERKGFARVRLDGTVYDLAADGILDGIRPQSIDLMIDRLVIREGVASRLADSLETAARFGDGIVKIEIQDAAGSRDLVFSQKFACVECGKALPEITPQLFSFNSPQGACPECGGLGLKIPRSRRAAAAPEDSSLEGQSCEGCGGTGLKPEALAVTIGEKNIFELASLSIAEAIDFFRNLSLAPKQQAIAPKLLDEIIHRLTFLVEVGVEYLTINRRSLTLSGGEAQRVRLATHIGSHLAGALYILDEPSIGLHPKDNERLISILERLRDAGNTVIVVEHDRETILAADDVVDMGPGPGVQGGEVIAHGTPQDLITETASLTGQYLAGRKAIADVRPRRPRTGRSLTIEGAREQNLKDITVEIPLGVITCVTGVSGAGKSTLVMDILYPALANRLQRAKMKIGAVRKLKGVEYLDRVIGIDQGAIGRTPRSTPATYTGLYDPIREFFAQLTEAR